MKKFILAALAASLVASPALAAPAQKSRTVIHQGPHQTVVVKKTVKQRYAPPPRVQYRNNWRKGERFDARYARNYRQVDYRQHRRLKAPPRGYRYVQSGNDAVLVGVATGLIAAIFAGALN